MFARTAVAFAVSTALMAGQALAFSCAGPPLSVIAGEADVVFAGDIVAVAYLDDNGRIDSTNEGPCGAHIATVAVTVVWFGDLGEEVRVYSDDACVDGGYYMEAGISAAFAISRGWMMNFDDSVTPPPYSATHCRDAVLTATEADWSAEHMPFVDEEEQ